MNSINILRLVGLLLSAQVSAQQAGLEQQIVDYCRQEANAVVSACGGSIEAGQNPYSDCVQFYQQRASEIIQFCQTAGIVCDAPLFPHPLPIPSELMRTPSFFNAFCMPSRLKDSPVQPMMQPQEMPGRSSSGALMDCQLNCYKAYFGCNKACPFPSQGRCSEQCEAEKQSCMSRC